MRHKQESVRGFRESFAFLSSFLPPFFLVWNLAVMPGGAVAVLQPGGNKHENRGPNARMLEWKDGELGP